MLLFIQVLMCLFGKENLKTMTMYFLCAKHIGEMLSDKTLINLP